MESYPNFTHVLRPSDDVATLDNDAKVSMVDEETGGGSDGLHRQGRKENQGAESTLALLSTLQHGRRLDGLSRGH